MNPVAFRAFLGRPSTTALLNRMLADNRRVDAQLASMDRLTGDGAHSRVELTVAHPDQGIEAGACRAEIGGFQLEFAQRAGDGVVEGVR